MKVLCFAGFLMGVFSFSMKIKHVLSMLLSLEFMVLMIFFVIMLIFPLDLLYLSLFFLIFSVCEGALGLTLLVAIARVFGGDYLNIMSMSS